MGVPLYVISCFSYSLFICNFCHDYNVSRCVPLWVHFVWDCFCFLEFGNCFAPKIRKFEAIISSDMFLGPLSPSSTFGDPYNVNISDALVLPEVSCFFFSFFLFFFFFCCSLFLDLADMAFCRRRPLHASSGSDFHHSALHFPDPVFCII